MCGEHLRLGFLLGLLGGSSPHVRGTLFKYRIRVLVDGIIPACAGNTCRLSNGYLIAWDHPRMCGEHPDASPSVKSTSGSSPHVRGTLRRHLQHHADNGIIPACAGNT